jgi:hypothetical protein
MSMRQPATARASNLPCRLKHLAFASAAAAVALTGCGSSSGEAVDGPLMRYPRSSSSDPMSVAEVRGVLELDGNCLYLTLDEGRERLPILWPSGTEWDSDDRSVVTSRGESLPLGGEVLFGGGYLFVVDVDRLAGSDAADLARECVDNAFGDNALGQIAIVNNSGSAISRP